MVVHANENSTASVRDVMNAINASLRRDGRSYSCKTVSWDDAQRGTTSWGGLSSWGANITDTRLYAKDGQQLYTVRADNFNEKLGSVSANELALIAGNHQQGGGTLAPVTLSDGRYSPVKLWSFALPLPLPLPRPLPSLLISCPTP